ncbi:MAG: RagB/SusD family nutrient uptake outer membrane protein [Reichenbachiella sp.]|uniref:RagB/SusD family nutrient uptake outer membrane protein n=1 Tax=Reichenbachiella sp. TaxID=2184521 RepID=UPI003296B999
MKNLKILFLALSVFYSCTDLDLQPKSSSTAELVFQEESAYQAFIAKLYAGFAVSGQNGPTGDSDITGIDEGESNYVRGLFLMQELPTDEATMAWNDGTLYDFNEIDWTDADRFNRAFYNRVFFQIGLVNEFLRETTDDKLDSRNVSSDIRSDIALYRAEARFIRAFCYWHAIDHYGDVPFFDETFGIGTNLPTQESREIVFDWIIDELGEIESQLAEPRSNEYGRVDRAALWMLRAKLFLNSEVYTGVTRLNECIEACEQVIAAGYVLDQDYSTLFGADNHLSTEFIWAIAVDGTFTQSYGATNFIIAASRGAGAPSSGTNQQWWGLRTPADLVNYFPGNPDENSSIDSRGMFWTDGGNRDIMINDMGDFANGGGYLVTKYTNFDRNGVEGSNGSTQGFVDTDFPMFRLADAYLMLAEAVVRGGTGNSSDPVALVNALRLRAYGDNSGAITAAELTADFIIEERARELYWEGHRRTDLIRHGTFLSGIWNQKGGVIEGVPITDDKYLLFPIPDTELIANPTITQNDGY